MKWMQYYNKVKWSRKLTGMFLCKADAYDSAEYVLTFHATPASVPIMNSQVSYSSEHSS